MRYFILFKIRGYDLITMKKMIAKNTYDVASILNDTSNVEVYYNSPSHKTRYYFRLQNTGKKNKYDTVLMSNANNKIIREESFPVTMITEKGIEQMIRDYESYL